MALASVLVSLLLAEVIVRAAVPMKGPVVGLGLFEADPLLGFRLRAGHRAGGIRTNDQGLRDVDRSIAKPAGTRRIVVLGDSFAFGCGIAANETFAWQLGERLRPDVDVVNAAVPAYSTVQERLWLEHRGLQYDPDAVIVAFFVGNDPWENLGTRHLEVKDGELVDGAPSIGSWLLYRSHLARWLWQMGEGEVNGHQWYLRTEAKRLDVCASDDQGLNDWARAWQVTRAELQRIRDLVAPRPVVVLAIPDEFQVDRRLGQAALARYAVLGGHRAAIDFGRPQRRLGEICRDLGLAVVDVLPTLRSRTEAGERLYLQDDSHWSAAGHAVAAQALAHTPPFCGWRR